MSERCFHVKSCLADSTAHGLPHLVKSGRSVVSKIFWILCFMLAAILFVLHTSTLLLQYMKSPTKMAISTDAKFIPPDVYICNRMPFSMGHIENSNHHNDSEFMAMKRIIDMNIYTYNEELFQNFSLNMLYHNFGGRSYGEFYRNLQILSKGKENEAPGSSVFEIIPNNRHMACYRLKKIYRDRLFSGVNDFIDIFLYSDSVAFKKPSYMIKTKVRFEEKYRPLATLKFTDLDNPSTVGFALYVVAPGYYPHPDCLSIEATAGFHTHIKLKMSTLKLLNKQEKPCTTNNRIVKYYNFIEPSRPIELKAGQWDCVYQRYHELAMKECNCTNHIYPVVDDFWKNGSAVYCQHHLLSHKKNCLDDKGVNNQLEKLYSDCASESPCRHLKYHAFVEGSLINIEELTQYDLHFEGQQNKFQYKEIYKRLVNIRNESVLDVIKIKESFHKIRIQRGEIMSTHWREDYTYVLRNFLSDVGGIVGFYMGISLITICELFGLCVSCITERKMNRAGSNTDIEMTKPT